MATCDGSTIEAPADLGLPVEIEVSRGGCWPGGSDEGSWDPDAHPAPDGFADRSEVPAAASYT